MATSSRLCIHFTYPVAVRESRARSRQYGPRFARFHGEGRFMRSSHLQRPTQAYDHTRVFPGRQDEVLLG